MPELDVEDVIFQTGERSTKGYIARPRGGRHPAIIVIHEIFGLDEHHRDVARRFAREGLVALAPDLYSAVDLPCAVPELEVAIKLSFSLPPEKRRDTEAIRERLGALPESQRAGAARALDWLRARDLAKFVPALRGARDFLASREEVDPDRIFSIGFCMGGALSVRLASSGADLAGCIIFYGESPRLDEVANIRCPVLGIYGGEDKRINDTVHPFAVEMRRAGKRFEHHLYPGAPHAFFNDTRPLYRREDAADAWRRSLDFIRDNLGS